MDGDAQGEGYLLLPPEAGINLVLAARVIRRLTSTIPLEIEALSKAYSQGTCAVFIYLCGLLPVDPWVGIDTEKLTKRVAFDKLVSLVSCEFNRSPIASNNCKA